jgi:SAM-dependent methyltransferase
VPEELHACVLCGGKDFRVSHTIGSWQIQKCGECELLFLNPRPTLQEYHALYSTYWGYPPLPTDQEEKSSAIARESARVRRIERFVNPGALLDVGCGSGVFLACAREHGWDVWGVEIAKHCVDYARE